MPTTRNHPLQWRRDQLLDELGELKIDIEQLRLDRLAYALNTVHFLLAGEDELAFAAAQRSHDLDVEIKARAWGDDL